LKLADDAPLHLHEPKGHFDTNMTLACVVIEIIISLIPLIDTSVDQTMCSVAVYAASTMIQYPTGGAVIWLARDTG
jgi:hypothetical protein